MRQRTEEEHLKEIKLKIENILIQPRREYPPLVQHYNELYGKNCQYRNPHHNIKQGRDHESRSKSRNQKTPTKQLQQRSRPKLGDQEEVTNYTPKGNHQKSPSFQTSPLQKGASATKKKVPNAKTNKSTKNIPKKSRENVDDFDSSAPDFQEKLSEIKSRYVQLATLSMKTPGTRSSSVFRYDPKQKQRQDDSAQMKKQLENELVRYTKAIRQGTLNRVQRFKALQYIGEIMDKFEFLLS